MFMKQSGGPDGNYVSRRGGGGWGCGVQTSVCGRCAQHKKEKPWKKQTLWIQMLPMVVAMPGSLRVTERSTTVANNVTTNITGTHPSHKNGTHDSNEPKPTPLS